MNDMIQPEEKKQQGTMFFLLMTVMLTVFCVLKVLRGSDTESTAVGGIWNYISLLYYPIFLFVFFTQKTCRVRTVFVSSLLYVLFTVFSAILNSNLQLSISTIYQFLMVPYSILVFWTFYLCSDESNLGEKIILAGYFGCLGLNLYSILMFRFAGAAPAMESDIYFSLGLFPFALQLLKNSKVKTGVIVLELLAVFMVNKRTALISFAIALVVYLLIDACTKERSKIGATVKTILIATVGIVLFYRISRYIDDKYNMNIYYRLFRLAEDGGSGRSDIYERVWEGFQKSSFIEMVFGHGMNTAGKIGGAGQAHNDFLEILYNYGILPFVSVVVFYLSLIVEGIRLVRRESPYAAAFAFSLIVGLFLAMFSYFTIYYTYVTCIMAFWGYAMAMEDKRLSCLEGD